MKLGTRQVITTPLNMRPVPKAAEPSRCMVTTISTKQAPALVLGLDKGETKVGTGPQVLSERDGRVAWRTATALLPGDRLLAPVHPPRTIRASEAPSSASGDHAGGPADIDSAEMARDPGFCAGLLLGSSRIAGVKPPSKDLPFDATRALAEFVSAWVPPGTPHIAVAPYVLDRVLADPGAYASREFVRGLLINTRLGPKQGSNEFWRYLMTTIAGVPQMELMSILGSMLTQSGFPCRIKSDMLGIGPADHYHAQPWAEIGFPWSASWTSRASNIAPPCPPHGLLEARRDELEDDLTIALQEIRGLVQEYELTRENGRVSSDALSRLRPDSPALRYLWPEVMAVDTWFADCGEYEADEVLCNNYMVKRNQ